MDRFVGQVKIICNIQYNNQLHNEPNWGVGVPHTSIPAKMNCALRRNP